MEVLKLVPAPVPMLISRASVPLRVTRGEYGDEPEEPTASSSLNMPAEALSTASKETTEKS